VEPPLIYYGDATTERANDFCLIAIKNNNRGDKMLNDWNETDETLAINLSKAVVNAISNWTYLVYSLYLFLHCLFREANTAYIS